MIVITLSTKIVLSCVVCIVLCDLVNMQTYKLNPVIKLASFNKKIIRTVAVASNNSDVVDDNLKSWREIPGPSSLPVIGQLHHFLPGGEFANITTPGEIQKLYDKYGPMLRFDGVLGLGAMVAIGDPEIAAQVLRGENVGYPVRPGFFTLEHYRRAYKISKGHDIRTTGLITDHGEVWKDFRSTVNPVLLQPKTIKLYATVLDEVAQDMIKRMKSGRDEKNMIRNNFDTEMNLWALESIGTVALGCRLNCLNSNLPKDSPEQQMIQCVHDLFETADKLDFKPSLWRYISTPTFKKAMKLYEHHENLTKYFVQKGMKQLKVNASHKSDSEKGILEKLLEINEEYAYIMATDMLFAGVDTAANAMTSLLYLLAINQDKQDKLREEILSGSDKRPYLKACMKEAMRLMPIVSGNIRQATKDYNLRGYRIPKGMNVVFSHREMSLSEQNYPRAQEFIPERWFAEKDDPLYYRNSHPFAHSPFGFGIRSCIGRRIAELEVATFLPRVIENFKVEWFGPPPKLIQTALIYVKGPYNFVFTDIK